MPDPPQPGAVEPALPRALRRALGGIEQVLYAVVGVLLLGAAALVLAGTFEGVAEAVRDDESALDIGIVLLDRILLALIVAELLHTLRYVIQRGQIIAEPFLFIGLIAVVRRILIVTAEVEREAPAGRDLTNQLLELGLLGVLALTLAVAIYLVRRSADNDQAAAPA